MTELKSFQQPVSFCYSILALNQQAGKEEERKSVFLKLAEMGMGHLSQNEWAILLSHSSVTKSEKDFLGNNEANNGIHWL